MTKKFILTISDKDLKKIDALTNILSDAESQSDEVIISAQHEVLDIFQRNMKPHCENNKQSNERNDR